MKTLRPALVFHATARAAVMNFLLATNFVLTTNLVLTSLALSLALLSFPSISLAQGLPVPDPAKPVAPVAKPDAAQKDAAQKDVAPKPDATANPEAVQKSDAAQRVDPPLNISEEEQKELNAALTDANASPPDMIRILEAFIQKHPEAGHRRDIEGVLARAAIDAKDDRRTVLYGRRVLAYNPDDILLLDRVARSLLINAGTDRSALENATASLTYSRAFAEKITQAATPDGKEAARKQDERDRALSRAVLYQSRAKTVLGEKEEAERLAATAFAVYPTEEIAREWSETLDRLGRPEDALARLADAFTVPDAHATDADRAADRKRLGERYRQLHDSETGLGDLVLGSYDHTAALVEQHRARLRALDPNFSETEPMQFTLTGLDGKSMLLGSLKGSVVILDFWATWCTPCRVQHPLYEEAMQRFKDRPDVVFLSIDTDEDRALVSPFLDQQKWSRTVYFENGLQRLLQVNSIPTTILFDKQGHIAARMTGFLPDKFVDQLTERIQSALSESSLIP